MAQATWEKTAESAEAPVSVRSRGRWKFLVGGVLILAAVVYLIISSTTSGARYFITVNDLLGKSEYVGKTVRIAGAVIGDTIKYDSKNLIIEFTLAHTPQEGGADLATTLHQAVINPNIARLPVRVENQVKPDLLQNEAQAILTGVLGQDGVFRASELLLKCPSRYEEADPAKAIAEPKK